MEASKNYVDFYDLVSSISRIANNMDKLLEIMTTTSIKMDPEKARSVLNEWYGNMVMDEVQKKFWTANEIGKKDEEIQDLKLENDRLKKRDEIAQHFIKSVRCKGLVCENCDLHFLNAQGTDLCAQVDHVKLEAVASNVLKKMEDL